MKFCKRRHKTGGSADSVAGDAEADADRCWPPTKDADARPHAAPKPREMSEFSSSSGMASIHMVTHHLRKLEEERSSVLTPTGVRHAAFALTIYNPALLTDTHAMCMLVSRSLRRPNRSCRQCP